MRTTNKHGHGFGMFSAVLGMTILTGCIHGGRFASNSLDGKRVLATYRPAGRPDARQEYVLIETGNGLQLIERVQGGIGSLIKRHWRDADGDHFAIWGEVLDTRVPASEFVLPLDRTQKGKAFIYPEGTYSVLKIDGQSRPATSMPNPRPAFWLVPREDFNRDEQLK